MTTFPATHVSVPIDCPADQVYAFASNPENLPRWASGLSSGIRKVGEDWIADSPMGTIKVKLADPNPFGVLDHDVTLATGETFYNPMRVFPNNEGSECVFTLYRRPGVTDKAFADDRRAIETDLRALKAILES
ncbi:MAG: SRPBCC family protein [Anaerolineae bacterium]|nr:SRPBCC family protein [Anaerolineae bacterium]